MTIQVHQTRSATPIVAGWAQALLGPAILACRITMPVPLELRPTGAFGGWCSTRRTGHPDGRIQVSNRAVFWSQKRFVTTYVHETAHRILGDAGDADFAHNAAFFALQLALFLRMDSENVRVADFGGGWANCPSLYDLQDPPAFLAGELRDVWFPRCFSWALAVASGLAETDMAAEACAADIISMYRKWVSRIEKEPAETLGAEMAAHEKNLATQREFAALRDLSRCRFWYSFVWFSGFFVSFFSFVFLAAR